MKMTLEQMEAAREREEALREREDEMSANDLSKAGLLRRAINAAREGSPWALEECLEREVDPAAETSDEQGSVSLLTLAAGSRSAACVRMVQEKLRERGLPTCSKRALEAASVGWPGHREVIAALLEGNALDKRPLSDAGLGGSEALEKAIRAGSREDVLVWAKGAPGCKERPTRSGLLPLALAAGVGEIESVRALLSVGANPWGRDCNGSTALMSAAAMSEPCLRELLPVSDPLATDACGQSALMFAACAMTHEGTGNPRAAALLAPESDKAAKDRDGRTALNLALLHGAGDCADAMGEIEGELTLAGDEERAIEALRRKGFDGWAAQVEREKLERLGPAPERSAKPRL